MLYLMFLFVIFKEKVKPHFLIRCVMISSSRKTN